MIVKNEAHVIARCLRSVKPFIDYYSISDTGSTDDTMAIILKELEGIPGALKSDPWEGFAPNRNNALKRAKGDFILSIDADEILVHTGGPIELALEYDQIFIEHHSPTLTFWSDRLFRNDPRWSWEGNIHNYIKFDGEPKSTRIHNLQIRHLFDSHQNIEGNKFLKHLAYYENAPATPRNVFYHAQTLMELGRNEEAIKKYHERVEMGGWEEEVYYSLWKAADLMDPNRPLHQIVSALYGAYRYRTSRYEALVKLCQILRNNKEYDEVYRLSLVDPKLSDNILFVDHRAPWIIYFEHANAAYRLGKFDESEKYFQRINEIATSWTSAEDFAELSHLYYQVEQWNDSIEAARKALELNPEYAPAWNNICCSNNMLGNFAEAKKAGEEAVRLKPNNEIMRNNLNLSIGQLSIREHDGEILKDDLHEPTAENFVDLSLAYYQAESYGECIAAALEALKLRTDYAEAFNNIAASYLKLEKWELAIDAANEALRIRPHFQTAKNNLATAIAQKDKLLRIAKLT